MKKKKTRFRWDQISVDETMGQRKGWWSPRRFVGFRVFPFFPLRFTYYLFLISLFDIHPPFSVKFFFSFNLLTISIKLSFNSTPKFYFNVVLI